MFRPFLRVFLYTHESILLKRFPFTQHFNTRVNRNNINPTTVTSPPRWFPSYLLFTHLLYFLFIFFFLYLQGLPCLSYPVCINQFYNLRDDSRFTCFSPFSYIFFSYVSSNLLIEYFCSSTRPRNSFRTSMKPFDLIKPISHLKNTYCSSRNDDEDKWL